MHELSYISRLANLAIETATANNALTVESITIQVGEMTGLVPEYLQNYYPSAVKGTILEGSRLEIEYLHVVAKCSNCGNEFTPSKEDEYLCPKCHNSASSILHGREFLIKNIILDDGTDK